MERKKYFDEVEDIFSFDCKDCFVYKHFKKEKGKRFAHKFCISECTVGEKLKSIGNKLGG